MKRFLLATASVMGLGIAAPAFAQTSDSYVDQILGSNNTATVDQTASGGANNLSDVEQTGTGNTAKVTQSGSGGSGGSGGRGGSGEAWWDNESWILQNGTGHTAEVIQMSKGGWNSSEIQQFGRDNFAKVEQWGESDNWSRVIQYDASN